MLTLPWPPYALGPNARDRGKKVRLVRTWRETGFWLAREAKLSISEAQRVAVLVFHHPKKRLYDLDNALNCCKPMIDGVADHLGIDDSEFEYVLLKGESVRGGKVLMSFDTRETLLRLGAETYQWPDAAQLRQENEA